MITYIISDGTDTDSATLTITVGGDVTGPVVTAATVAFGSGRVDETAPLTDLLVGARTSRPAWPSTRSR